MTKPELIDAVAAESGLTRTQAARALDAVGNVVACTLVAGREVSVPGLGKFRRKMMSARQHRNPQTGEPVSVPAHHKAVFAPTSTLRDSIR